MGKRTRKRKSTEQHLPVVTPKRSTGRGSDASPNQTTFKVDGAGLVKVFKHIKMGVPDLQNLWISGDDWCKIIPHYSSTIKNYANQITTKKFTAAMNRQFGGYETMNRFREKNDYGVFANQFGCPKKYYYLFTNDDEKLCHQMIPSTTHMSICDWRQIIKILPALAETESDVTNDDNNNNQQQQQKRSEQLKQQNFFNSGEAWNVFMPAGLMRPEETQGRDLVVKQFIEARIAVCASGAEEWFCVIQGMDSDDDLATDREKKHISYQCRYIMIALSHALAEMEDGVGPTWQQCCEHAINKMKSVFDAYIHNAETVMRWHRIFCDAFDTFPHPNPLAAAGEIREPPFFSACPAARLMFLSHADELAAKGELKAELLASYVNKEVVKIELKECNDEREEDDKLTRNDFLRSFGIGYGRRPKNYNDDNDEVEEEEEELNISLGTITRWMNIYGYKWCQANQHYYNDRHEHPLTLKAREIYIKVVLFQFEVRSHCWIQISKQDADKLREERDGKRNVAPTAGYEYTALDGETYVEFHVDDCSSFKKIMAVEGNRLGGDRSCLFIQTTKTIVTQWEEDDMFDEHCQPKVAGYEYKDDNDEDMVEVHARHFIDSDETRHKLHASMIANGIQFNQSLRNALIIFGQDEAIYRQFMMNSKLWAGRGGKQTIRPKDPGQGLMISAIKSRAFGWIRELSDEDMVKVNLFRRNVRNTYDDEAAAIKVTGSKTKKDLDKAKFMIVFDYGNNAEGYWTYDRMVIQLEDCIDIMDALHSSPPEDVDAQRRCHMTRVPNATTELLRHFDYAFGFDHSQGHDRKRPDALDVNELRKGPSSSAGINMRSSTIESKDYLGKYDHPMKLKIGDTQKMRFEETDNWGNIEVGPVLWSDQKRQYRTNVVCTENPTRTVQKNKDDLAADLQEHNMFSKGTVAQLQQRCQNAEISLQKQVPNVLHEGFIKMSKGKFQILWERGFINPDRATWKSYTLEGPKDERGKIIKEYSLNHLMSLLPDFENEKTLLHHHGEALGCIIFNSPKCTPEIAGEGIEYDWGVSKLYYKAQDVERKRKRTNFNDLVFEAIGERVLSLETVRSNAKRAREHMICYYELQKNGQDSAPSDVKRMMKMRKTHSCVVDMDKGYLSARVRAILAAERGRQ